VDVDLGGVDRQTGDHEVGPHRPVAEVGMDYPHPVLARLVGLGGMDEAEGALVVADNRGGTFEAASADAEVELGVGHRLVVAAGERPAADHDLLVAVRAVGRDRVRGRLAAPGGGDQIDIGVARFLQGEAKLARLAVRQGGVHDPHYQHHERIAMPMPMALPAQAFSSLKICLIARPDPKARQ